MAETPAGDSRRSHGIFTARQGVAWAYEIIRTKSGLQRTINCIQEMADKKIEEEAEASERLQIAAGQKNMRLIWDYRRKLRNAANARNIATKKKDGTDCQGMGETMKRWEEWTEE